MSTPRNRAQHVIPILAILIALLAESVAGQQADVEQLMTSLGFDIRDSARLLNGDILSGELTERGGKELAITLAIFIKAPPSTIAEQARSGNLLESPPKVSQLVDRSDPAAAEAMIAKVVLPADELAKISKMDSMSSDFNLSADEAKTLENALDGRSTGSILSDPTTQAAIRSTYAKILVRRFADYWNSGVKGVRPYDRRKGKEASPADELAGALEGEAVLESQLPDFYAAFRDYPASALDDVENQFLCQQLEAHGRPATVLAHRMYFVGPDGAVLAERQFYVGHTYNSLQIIVGALPIADGTVLFYRNRTFTDQVAGFGGGAKRGIGEHMMRDAISKELERIRQVVDVRSRF